MTFFEFINLFLNKKRLLACCIGVAVVAAGAYCLLVPEIYRAEALIRPASQGADKMAAMSASLGGLASMVGLGGFGGGTTGELLMAVTRSETIIDRAIDRFGLMELYKEVTRLKMRNIVRRNILHLNEDVRSGIVSVAVLDEDPQRAADMANFFIEELQQKMRTLAIGQAAQRRIFFGGQLKEAFEALSEAEEAMALYQQESGMVAMEPQLEALFTAMAQLRAQIAAKEVELSALRTYAKQNNPSLKLAQTQLNAMQRELKLMEEQQKRKGATSGDAFPTMRQAPKLGLEYQRKLRDVKFAEAMYELMLKQFEAARLEEANEAIIVQVVNPATPPDYKFKPKRAAILIFSVLAGVCVGVLMVLGRYYIDTARAELQCRGNIGE